MVLHSEDQTLAACRLESRLLGNCRKCRAEKKLCQWQWIRTMKLPAAITNNKQSNVCFVHLYLIFLSINVWKIEKYVNEILLCTTWILMWHQQKWVGCNSHTSFLLWKHCQENLLYIYSRCQCTRVRRAFRTHQKWRCDFAENRERKIYNVLKTPRCWFTVTCDHHGTCPGRAEGK